MKVDITSELDRFVQTTVDSGRFDSASDVVREALKLLEERNELFARRREDVSNAIEEGWKAAQSGELADGNEFFDRVDAEWEVLERSAAQ